MEKEVNSTKIRRILKAAFITVALVLFISILAGSNHRDARELGASIADAFAVLFGVLGASLGAILSRSLVKIPSPSKKLLIIVSISCGAGFVLGALLSGMILRVTFAIGMIMGIISVIVGVFGYIAAYFGTILVFTGGMMSGAAALATDETGTAAELRESIRKDKTGIREKAFWDALSDLEKQERGEG